MSKDSRWSDYSVPPEGNANYAWILHMVSKLSVNGIAGFVLANGSMSTNTTGEGAIRQKMIENDLVDCMIALPGQLFYTTQIPVCLWFLTKNKTGQKTQRNPIPCLLIGVITSWGLGACYAIALRSQRVACPRGFPSTGNKYVRTST